MTVYPRQKFYYFFPHLSLSIVPVHIFLVSVSGSITSCSAVRLSQPSLCAVKLSSSVRQAD